MLDQGAVLQPEERRPPADPLLESRVALQLSQIVQLAAVARPEAEPGPVPERPEHQDLVVAEQHLAVGPVARVAERADAERAAVDQVAQEDGPVLSRGIGLERSEQPLQVSMDVADDEDRECFGLHSDPGSRRMVRV